MSEALGPFTSPDRRCGALGVLGWFLREPLRRNRNGVYDFTKLTRMSAGLPKPVHSDLELRSTSLMMRCVKAQVTSAQTLFKRP